MKPSCLIVGAGVAGLSAGRELVREGWQVTVLDKGRAVGGRMATRTFDGGRFDYGAQFFTLRDAPFAAIAADWIDSGAAVPWTDRRYRVPGGMRTIPEKMALGLDVQTAVRVQAVRRMDTGWAVETESGEFLVADTIILTPPVPQTLALLETGRVEITGARRALLAEAHYRKTLTLLVRIEGEARLGPQGFREPAEGILSWVADNHAKGVSKETGCLTLHATAEFSEANWEESASAVTRQMLDAAAPYFEGRVRGFYLHRWRFAEPAGQMPEPFLAADSLVIAGDAFGGPRVGGAATSGLAAAAYLLNR